MDSCSGRGLWCGSGSDGFGTGVDVDVVLDDDGEEERVESRTTCWRVLPTSNGVVSRAATAPEVAPARKLSISVMVLSGAVRSGADEETERVLSDDDRPRNSARVCRPAS